MSNSSKRRTAPPRSQPGKAGRPVWLLTTVLVLAGIAVVSGLVWLAQRDGTAPAQTLATQTAPADSATASGPRIAVDKELFDYGNVKLNSTIETSVHVKNVGDKLLALDPAPVVEVIEGCWPPRAVVGSTTLAPGEETDIKLSFMMHAGMAGQHEFRVHVRSTDPHEPDKQVVIRSNWIP